MNHKFFTPLLLIALGLMFLAHNLGVWPNLGQLWATCWPLILIAVGLNHFTRPRRACRRSRDPQEVSND